MSQLKAKIGAVGTIHKLVAVVLFCLPFVGLIASVSYLAIVTK